MHTCFLAIDEKLKGEKFDSRKNSIFWHLIREIDASSGIKCCFFRIFGGKENKDFSKGNGKERRQSYNKKSK